MTETSLKTFAAKTNAQRIVPITQRSEAEDGPDYQAFAYGRVGTRAELMIDFQKADGSHVTLSYFDMEIETADPSRGFILLIAKRRIIVEGTNLGQCFRYLRQHRVAELIEADRPAAMKADGKEAIITSLRVQKAG